VQDEAELSLLPTLTRMWMLRGHQTKIRAPGVKPPKRHECAATDWRKGHIVHVRSEKRDAATFCQLLDKCVARSACRKRRVIVVADRARFHRPETSRLVADSLLRYGRRLTIRYVPSYSPDCNPQERLWEDWRDHVTHNHDRLKIEELEQDSDAYFARRVRRPATVLQTIGSPFANR
jgi:hypothetical protein